MINFPADQDVTLRVDFVVGGELEVPDAATSTIRGNVGEVLDGPTAITLGPTQSYATITVPAALNDKTLGIEKRSVVVTYEVEGAEFTTTVTYLLVDALPLLFGAPEVMSWLGLDADDLSDQDIDMMGAYYALKAILTTGVLDAALSSTDPNTQLRANWAVIYKAITQIAPQSLKIRLNQIEKSDATSFTRFKDIDFDALIADAAGRLDEIVEELDPDTASQATLLILTNPTDQFTGV